MMVVITRARLSDSRRLTALWLTMMRDMSQRDDRIVLSRHSGSYYQDYLERHIRQSESDVLVARDDTDRSIVGYCLAHVAQSLPMFSPERYGYLSDLVIREDWRRRGIGQALVENVEAAMRARGVDCMQLHVYDCNETALDFWDTLGYGPMVQGRCKWLE